MIEFGRDVADDEWHTLYIKRRADELDVWVDDGDKVSGRWNLKYVLVAVTLLI